MMQLERGETESQVSKSWEVLLDPDAGFQNKRDLEEYYKNSRPYCHDDYSHHELQVY